MGFYVLGEGTENLPKRSDGGVSIQVFSRISWRDVWISVLEIMELECWIGRMGSRRDRAASP